MVGAHSLEELAQKLKKPRRVMMLVKAGSAVDDFIDKLVPHLEKGDIIIDGGNSEYTDSIVGRLTCSSSSHKLVHHTHPYPLPPSLPLPPPPPPSPLSLSVAANLWQRKGCCL